jgi:hypothetical protein
MATILSSSDSAALSSVIIYWNTSSTALNMSFGDEFIVYIMSLNWLWARAWTDSVPESELLYDRRFTANKIVLAPSLLSLTTKVYIFFTTEPLLL